MNALEKIEHILANLPVENTPDEFKVIIPNDLQSIKSGVEFTIGDLRELAALARQAVPAPEVIRLAPVAGWAHPLLSKKWHYFKADDIVSVCGKWMLAGERDDTLDEHPDNCMACKKKVTKLRKG